MKKNIKRIIAVILLAAIATVTAGCGEIAKAEAAIDGMFGALIALDFEKANEFVDVDKLGAETEGDSTDTKMFMRHLFDRLQYEIVASKKVDGENVDVTVKITAVDMKPVLAEYLAEALKYSFSVAFKDPQPTDEEMAEKMEDIFMKSATKDDLKTVTNEIVVRVTKTDGQWKVESGEALADALLGGLSAAGKELQATDK